MDFFLQAFAHTLNVALINFCKVLKISIKILSPAISISKICVQSCDCNTSYENQFGNRDIDNMSYILQSLKTRIKYCNV